MSGVPAGRLPAPYAAPGRRALQVTLVATAGFHLFRYGLDRPDAAVYALFAAVALGGLSRIPGTGRQRAGVVLRLIPVGWVLVAVGTWLSARTWSAVAGMLVIGFALAFSAVGGPRPAGAAPGLQLLYILPSFPPYHPGSLGERLLGTTTGMALLVVAEALLFPEPNPPPYRERAAHAASVAAHCARLLGTPPYALTRADVRTAREAGHRLRSHSVPEADRPAGPGVRPRALAHTGLAARTLLSRLPRLSTPPDAPTETSWPTVPGAPPRPAPSGPTRPRTTPDAYDATDPPAASDTAERRTGSPDAPADHTERPPAPAAPTNETTDPPATAEAAPHDTARRRTGSPDAPPDHTERSPAPGTGATGPEATRGVPVVEESGPPDTAAAVLAAVARLAAGTAGCLRVGTSPVGEYKELAAVRAALVAQGTGASAAAPQVLRRHAAVLEVADAALAMGVAADLAAHGRRAAIAGPPERFWYAAPRAPVLWWHRVRGHAERRSVFFQNAVRIALALTAARLVAGVDTLPHGFWALLATLTLTRTTVDETWSAVRSALAGTLAGALVAGGTLALAGTHTTVYAVVLPLWMLFAFTVGPVKGVGWAQGLFTVLVALVFAQLAPATWRLAEVRLLDVVVGSAIGAVFGLLAWPRGAQDELRFAAAELLRKAAEIVVATGAAVARREPVPPVPGSPGHRSLRHAVILAESAYVQFQSEPAPFGGRGRTVAPAAVDWQAALMAGHHTLWGSQRLLEPPRTGLGPPAAGTVSRLGDRVAGRMLLVSAALDPGGDTPEAPLPRFDRTLAGADAEPPGAPGLYYATVSWLDSLMADLSRLARAGPAPGPDGGAQGH
ncbi:FUSC family protein [Streptomyces sp. F-1]|uniref:FUSC family protein n=1 Tax=Streptomyces sp. F-1 TaxID=463642 RepID=UPI001EFB8A20|nr:FUSC family protein [Streptomyces sp. F-1]